MRTFPAKWHAHSHKQLFVLVAKEHHPVRESSAPSSEAPPLAAGLDGVHMRRSASPPLALFRADPACPGSVTSQ